MNLNRLKLIQPTFAAMNRFKSLVPKSDPNDFQLEISIATASYHIRSITPALQYVITGKGTLAPLARSAVGRAPREFLVFELANDRGEAAGEGMSAEKRIKVLVDIESHTEVDRILDEEVWKDVKLHTGLIAVGNKAGGTAEMDWFMHGIEGITPGL